MSRLRGRHIFFPYWWIAWAYRQQPLFRDYLILRQGLTNAGEKGGRLTSPIPANINAEKAVEWLYQILSVLDTKASALMRLNGVMLAAATFLLGVFTRTDAGRIIEGSHGMVLWIAALSSVSIALCLLVVSIDWSFLGLVRRTEDKLDFTEEIDHLERVSKFRQLIYRIAWVVSFIAAVLFVVTFVFQL